MIEVFHGRERLCTADVANSFYWRMLGLMFRKKLAVDHGLLIEFSKVLGSKAIHGFFMRFNLDLIFIDTDKKVVDICTLRPWSVYNPARECAWVLEVNEWFIEEKNVKKGDVLSFQS